MMEKKQNKNCVIRGELPARKRKLGQKPPKSAFQAGEVISSAHTLRKSVVDVWGEQLGSVVTGNLRRNGAGTACRQEAGYIYPRCFEGCII